jgi:hypothetical protein
MKLKQLRSISRILGVLIIVCLIPSCAFASENNKLHPHSDAGFGPAGNVTAENFASVRTSILDSISKQISELQNFYTNVSEASNATELQEVLADHRPANECMGPSEMNRKPAGMNVFDLDKISNVTDDNFTEVQTEIVSSLGNMTDRLNDQLNDTNVTQDSNRTEETNAKITEIENLSTEVSEASNSTELKEIIFTYVQTQSVESIDKEIEHLQSQTNDTNCTSGNTTELSSRITELTTLKEKINAADSLDSLKEILSSSTQIPGIGGPMGPGGPGGSGPCMDHPK